MTILDRYLSRAVIGGSLLVMAVLMALSAFVGVVGQLGDVGTANYGLLEAVFYVLLSLPGQAVELMPVAVLIGTLLSLGALAGQNELTVMRAAGMPVTRIARGAIYGGLVLAVASLLMAEWVAPAAERHAEQMRATALDQNVNFLGGSVWLRDEGQFINTQGAAAPGDLRGIHLYRFDESGRLEVATVAERAVHHGGKWRLRNVRETRPSEDRVAAGQVADRDWQTGIGPRLLSLVAVSPEMLSAKGLFDYVRYLEANNLESANYRIAFWFKFVIPAALPVMVLLAMPFLFGSLRSSGAGQRLMVGLVIGIAFYLVNITLSNVGALLTVPPFVVAWTPTLLLFAVSLWVVRRI